MGKAVGFVTVLIVVVAGGYIYMNQLQTVSSSGTTPQTTIDVTAVRNDLLAIANAQRRYWVTNAKYASLQELATNGDIPIPRRAHYVYSAEATDSAFRVIATYTGPDPGAPKRISVDDTMTLTTE